MHYINNVRTKLEMINVLKHHQQLYKLSIPFFYIIKVVLYPPVYITLIHNLRHVYRYSTYVIDQFSLEMSELSCPIKSFSEQFIVA
jgi:hypothetical protein